MGIDSIVADESDAIANIRLFSNTPSAGFIHKSIGYARNWYTFRDHDAGWLFGPMRFIGYVGNLEAASEPESDARDGRILEAALKEWFEPVDEGHSLESELKAALRRFLSAKGKSLNQLARIHVLKRDVPGLSPVQRQGADESWRITSSAEMLGGKPCIRGLRIRVADILEMLALGATRRSILEDYSYLEDGDITAALQYAVTSVDHRLIKAA